MTVPRAHSRTGKVIGCVHGAWSTLQAELDDAPDYDWCEDAWRAYGLSRLLGPPPIDPDALVAHLRIFWANYWHRPGPDAPPEPAQLTLEGIT